MKFDVIIGNPPYQLADGSGGSSDSAMPIYNKFISYAKKLNPVYLSMIVPSKWMVGGRGLDKFREEMKLDTHIKFICDYADASFAFPGIHMDGGVCYFLWHRNYNGKTKFRHITQEGVEVISQRELKNEYSKFVIRDSRIISILNKTNSINNFSSIVSSVRPFGIRKYLFNEPERYPESKLNAKYFQDSVKIYGVKGIKGGAKRQVGYITRKTATNNTNWIDKYKLFFTTSYSTNAVEPPEIILGMPNDICTETFLVIGPFETKTEQENCLIYMNTSFFKFLLYHGKGTMQVTSSVFSMIPLQDFKYKTTDKCLFKKYHLVEEEIQLINSLFS